MTFPRQPLPDDYPLDLFFEESIHIEDLLRGLFLYFGEFNKAEDINAIGNLTNEFYLIGECFANYDWIISACSGSAQDITEIKFKLSDGDDNGDECHSLITTNAHQAAFLFLQLVANSLFPQSDKCRINVHGEWISDDWESDAEYVKAWITERFDMMEYRLSGIEIPDGEIERLASVLSRERACVYHQYSDCLDEPDQGELPAPGTDPRYQNLTVKGIHNIIGYSVARIRDFINELEIEVGDDGYYTLQGLYEIVDHIQLSNRPKKIHRGKVATAKAYLDSL